MLEAGAAELRGSSDALADSPSDLVGGRATFAHPLTCVGVKLDRHTPLAVLRPTLPDRVPQLPDGLDPLPGGVGGVVAEHVAEQHVVAVFQRLAKVA